MTFSGYTIQLVVLLCRIVLGNMSEMCIIIVLTFGVSETLTRNIYVCLYTFEHLQA